MELDISTTQSLAAEAKTCTPEYCGGFKYDDIPKYYGGLFKTEQEIKEVEKKWVARHQKEFGNTCLSIWLMFLQTAFSTKPPDESLKAKRSIKHDFDQCCPTMISYVKPLVLKNINGKIRCLVHLPPHYQWIPKAECADSCWSHYCYGKCRIEQITVYLLVFKLGKLPPFEFDSFYVPGYCSCKSH